MPISECDKKCRDRFTGDKRLRGCLKYCSGGEQAYCDIRDSDYADMLEALLSHLRLLSRTLRQRRPGAAKSDAGIGSPTEGYSTVASTTANPVSEPTVP